MSNIHVIDVFKHYEPNYIACYVLLYERSAVIDPGPQSGVNHLIEELKRLKVRPTIIAPTHVHLDHAGGAAEVAKFFSARIIAHPKGARHIANPERLWEAAKAVLKDLAEVFGKPRGIEEDMIVIAEDGQKFDLGGDELVVLHAPGHAPHMLAYYLEDAKVLFPSDAVGVSFDGYVIPSTPPPFDYEKALNTLERLKKLDIESVALTHFGLADREVIERAKEKIKEWHEIARSCRDLVEFIERLVKRDEDVKALYRKYRETSPAIINFKNSVHGIFNSAKTLNS
jgi:hydroxyacylglutathione hydrolase